MRNLPLYLRSAGVLFVFGIVYHSKKNNRLKRLKTHFQEMAEKRKPTTFTSDGENVLF